nr:winged helix DNA-binding domain-containing protein [Micromonospora sp. DSM 115978]
MGLTSDEVLALRMVSLLLRETAGSAKRPGDVAGVVEWFGAMQAQDVASGMWSLGVRLPGATVDDIQAALERREAIRTWPMRGTVHLVPPRDAHWMLDLMGVRALAGAQARREYLGLPVETADRAVDVLGSALAGGGRFTRAQCLAALESASITGEGQRLYHLLWYASQRGVLCIAPHIGKEQTFVLLDEWVPDPHRPERDEALGIIARRYFRGHGPTTRQDFAGWTGLTATDAKRGIAAAGDAVAAVEVDGTEMYADAALLDAYGAVGPTRWDVDDLFVLPGFDEYLLGFKDRSLMVDAEHKKAIIPGNNGVFQSTVVRRGRVVATWKRTTAKTRTTVRIHPLTPVNRTDVEAAFARYGHYLGQPLRFDWA